MLFSNVLNCPFNSTNAMDLSRRLKGMKFGNGVKKSERCEVIEWEASVSRMMGVSSGRDILGVEVL